MSEQDTIYYKLKLKRTRTPSEVFEKMRKSIKKKGATKDWTYDISPDGTSMCVDFGEDKGETFRLSFNEKKQCEGFCKVFFPLSGELFDNEKTSEFKALINMIYSARSSFAEMEVSDEYGIAESYLDSKVNKIALRELTAEETERAERLFGEGHTDIPDFLNALMFDLRGLPYSDDFIPYINRRITVNYIMFWGSNNPEIREFFPAFAESFLYETTEYNGEGRLYKVKKYYEDLSGVYHSVCGFCFGMEQVCRYRDFKSGWDPKSVQVFRLYQGKYLPLLEAEDSDLGRCRLAYRFFVSILEFLGFKYVGRGSERNEQIDEPFAKAIRAYIETGNHNEYQNAFNEFCQRNREKH